MSGRTDRCTGGGSLDHLAGGDIRPARAVPVATAPGPRSRDATGLPDVRSTNSPTTPRVGPVGHRGEGEAARVRPPNDRVLRTALAGHAGSAGAACARAFCMVRGPE